ncbi:MAG: phage minor capsid protein [Bacteroidaceae bacterium]|nr:phage minor capsid protein [Bacteroidaceae bacterium]
MLTPQYLDQCPDALVDLYAQIEADIIADMAKRISKYDYYIPSAEWQLKKAKEMGLVHDEILNRISKNSNMSLKKLKALMKDAGDETLTSDDATYKNAGYSPTPLNASPALQKVLATGLKQTNGLFTNLTRTTAKNGSVQFSNALDRAYMQIVSGAFDPNTAVRNAVKDITSKGLDSIKYPTRTDTIEVAVRRAVMTGVNQTCGKLQEVRADEMGSDLVEITAHSGARPEHAEWQGKVFSRSGKHPKYPSLREVTGYGTATGLKGVNCRHDFYPFIEGVSEPAYTDKELENLDEQKYEYNGQKMTEYEATQKQRYIERQIRRWKRERHAMDAAGLPTGEASSKVVQWGRVQKDFLGQTGLKRQVDREKVGGTTGLVPADMEHSEWKKEFVDDAKISKAVEIPESCEYLNKADTNFNNKNISEDALVVIDKTIQNRLNDFNDFSFDEIKIAVFNNDKKSVLITDLEMHGMKKINKLYLNKVFFEGISVDELKSMCERQYNNGWWMSRTLEDLVNHEIMHARINYYNSYEKIEQLYELLKEDNRVKGFCRLVDNNPDEFLNEMYVAINKKMKIDEKYIKVYNEYIENYLGGNGIG